MEMLEQIYKKTKDKMNKSIESFTRELKSIRTGRASLTVLDKVIVECYGSKMPLNQIATLSIQDHKTINIEPWDKSTLKDIERGIVKSEVDITPLNNGIMIRLLFPPLTEERRIEFVKQIKQKAEQSKISMRNIRREANEEIKTLETNGDIGKDTVKVAHNEIEDITKSFVTNVFEITENKETEIMKI